MSGSDDDDDIMGLLPAGGARRPGVAAAPPRRINSFKAMMSENSSDDDDAPKKKSAPAAKPSKKESSKSDEGTESIQFQEADADKSDDVSLDLSHDGSPSAAAKKPTAPFSAVVPAADVPPVVQAPPKKSLDDIVTTKPVTPTTPPPPPAVVKPTSAPPTPAPVSVKPKYEVEKAPMQAVSKLVTVFDSKPQTDATATPPKAVPKKTATPPVVAKEGEVCLEPKAAEVRPPVVAAQERDEPAVVPQHVPREECDDEFLEEILPLHPSTRGGPKPPSAPVLSAAASSAAGGNFVTRSPSVGSFASTTAQAATIPRSPGNARSASAAAPTDPLEELLLRAQQRLKEKERMDLVVGATSSGAAENRPMNTSMGNSFRAPSPLRGEERRSLSSTANNSTAQPPNTLLVSMPPPPDTSKEARLQRENARLAEELAFLTRENQKLRGGEGSFGGSSEGTKLQLQIEVLRQQLRENELEFQRSKSYLESQVEDGKAHVRDLSDELKSYSTTAAQYEVLCRDKDQQLLAEQQQCLKLRSELSERQQELSRIRDDHSRQREDESLKLERTAALLEDAKRQRVQLTELNDKFCRDKEQAVAERRKMQEDLRLLQVEQNREKDKHVDEVASLRRDLDRMRLSAVEKERVLLAQLRDETKAKEHFHSKLLEVEETLSAQSAEYANAVRQLQDGQRKEVDDLQRALLQLSEKCRVSERAADELREEVEQKLQRERAGMTKESSEKTQAMKEQRDDALEKLRRLEVDHDAVLKERDHYRGELEKASDIASQWQRAKDKAETQCTKLSASLSMLIAQDEQLVAENERLRVDIEQSQSDVHSMRGDLDSLYRVEQQLQDLSVENDRLSDECGRLARERNDLISENGKLAEEMIKWRTEVRELITSKKAPSTSNLSGVNARQGSSSSGGIRLTKSNDFSF